MTAPIHLDLTFTDDDATRLEELLVVLRAKSPGVDDFAILRGLVTGMVMRERFNHGLAGVDPRFGPPPDEVTPAEWQRERARALSAETHLVVAAQVVDPSVANPPDSAVAAMLAHAAYVSP